MTGFYMDATLGWNWLNTQSKHKERPRKNLCNILKQHFKFKNSIAYLNGRRNGGNS